MHAPANSNHVRADRGDRWQRGACVVLPWKRWEERARDGTGRNAAVFRTYWTCSREHIANSGCAMLLFEAGGVLLRATYGRRTSVVCIDRPANAPLQIERRQSMPPAQGIALGHRCSMVAHRVGQRRTNRGSDGDDKLDLTPFTEMTERCTPQNRPALRTRRGVGACNLWNTAGKMDPGPPMCLGTTLSGLWCSLALPGQKRINSLDTCTAQSGAAGIREGSWVA